MCKPNDVFIFSKNDALIYKAMIRIYENDEDLTIANICRKVGLSRWTVRRSLDEFIDSTFLILDVY